MIYKPHLAKKVLDFLNKNLGNITGGFDVVFGVYKGAVSQYFSQIELKMVELMVSARELRK